MCDAAKGPSPENPIWVCAPVGPPISSVIVCQCAVLTATCLPSGLVNTTTLIWSSASYIVPKRDGEFQYRIKSASESHERVARESELFRE